MSEENYGSANLRITGRHTTIQKENFTGGITKNFGD